MGGGISVHNRCSTPLHVSLRQVGPMFYENHMQPDQTKDWNNVGNVWYSIIIRFGVIGLEFSDADVALPITGVVLVAGAFVTAGATAAAGAGVVASGIAAGGASFVGGTAGIGVMKLGLHNAHAKKADAQVSGQIFKVGNIFFEAANQEIVDKFLKDTGRSALVHGVYGNCKRWAVHGGPKMNRKQVRYESGSVYEENVVDLMSPYADYYIVKVGNYGC